jgi:pimeloyl-ACP methyl ester carboxylesterase
MKVPLDYSKPNGSQAAVPLIKLAAILNGTTGTYKGMILTNPGGPGNSGVDSILTYGDVLQSVIGTNYDIVAFDPRGIGNSIPLANCSAVPSSSRRSLEPSGPDFAPSFYNNTLSAAIKTAQACQIAIGGENDAGPHMTTSVNARDMVSITNAFAQTTEGKLIPNATLVNYWGFSYGTYIGEVLASMFPDRVGRFVIDGVVDADTWVAGLGTKSVIFTDEAFASFFEFCHLAGSSTCSFYAGNSAKDIRHRFEKILSAFNGPLAEVRNQTDAPLVEIYLETFKTLLFQSTYYPIAFYPILSDALLPFEAATINLTVDALINIGTQIK